MNISIGQAQQPCTGIIKLIFKDCDNAHKKGKKLSRFLVMCFAQ